MTIKVLGSGCDKCKKLESNVKDAIKALGIEASVEKVEDFKQIMAFGVMQTPALVIDEAVKSVGKVLTVDEVKQFLK
jgi:small redox-active disulfide protein 2